MASILLVIRKKAIKLLNQRYTALDVDGTLRPQSGAAPLGLRLRRSLPRSIREAWFDISSLDFSLPGNAGGNCASTRKRIAQAAVRTG